jgi:hypothetical protein
MGLTKPFAATCATPFHNELSTHCSITGAHTPNVLMSGIGSQPIFNMNSAVANKNTFGDNTSFLN